MRIVSWTSYFLEDADKGLYMSDIQSTLLHPDFPHHSYCGELNGNFLGVF